MFLRTQTHLRSFAKQTVRSYSPASVCVKNPATNYVITNLFADTEQTVISKAEKARDAQHAWKNVSLEKRKEMIQQYKANLAKPENIEELSRVLSSETGKPVSQAAGKLSF